MRVFAYSVHTAWALPPSLISVVNWCCFKMHHVCYWRSEAFPDTAASQQRGSFFFINSVSCIYFLDWAHSCYNYWFTFLPSSKCALNMSISGTQQCLAHSNCSVNRNERGGVEVIDREGRDSSLGNKTWNHSKQDIEERFHHANNACALPSSTLIHLLTLSHPDNWSSIFFPFPVSQLHLTDLLLYHFFHTPFPNIEQLQKKAIL